MVRSKDIQTKAQILYRLATSQGRALPNFIIIGVEKGGTTSLFHYLTRHPNIVAPVHKEPHYFSLRYNRGIHQLAWYRANFPLQAELNTPAPENGQARQTFEASTSYVVFPQSASRIKALLPTVRLIVLLRNPIDRAHSNYAHQVRLGAETLTFEQALDREMDSGRGAAEAERVRSDPDYDSRFYYKSCYCQRGIYADQLPIWLETFPADRLLILRSEDLHETPAKIYTQVLDYLGLPAWQPDQFFPYNRSRRATMAPETRARLSDFFQPHNQRLYHLLNRDFQWS